jgi:hypothetical protein
MAQQKKNVRDEKYKLNKMRRDERKRFAEIKNDRGVINTGN